MDGFGVATVVFSPQCLFDPQDKKVDVVFSPSMFV